MSKGALAALLIIIFVAGMGAGYALNMIAPVGGPPKGLTGEVKIGVLVDLSGALTTYGEDIKAAYEVAEEDVNAFLEQAGSNWRIKLIYEDTASSPDVATKKFESLLGHGIRIMLGPMMSPQCASLRSPAQSNDVLLISPSATAVTLSIPGDNLFRFCAVDDLQGPAIASTIYSSGIRYVISVFISNEWGVGLNTSVTEKFVSLGGKVLKYIPWSPDTIEFSPVVESINSAI